MYMYNYTNKQFYNTDTMTNRHKLKILATRGVVCLEHMYIQLRQTQDILTS